MKQNPIHRKTLTAKIKEQARLLGFDYCGVAKAGFLEEEAPRLESWLKRGNHGEMHYMANHFDKRLDPRLLVPGAKTVISLLFNYFPQASIDTNGYKIARYAYGEDYHFVLKRKLKDLLKFIEAQVGAVEGRVFTDSAPVMERAWAQKAGLGWIGKHTLLIHKQAGSYFFLAEVILDLELEYDGPVPNYCGTCTRCIDACPTQAITPYQVDASQCISYFTIELKNAMPETMQGQFENWIFGCDICQEVCPWNRFSQPQQHPELQPHPGLLSMNDTDWEEITETVFQEMFRKSAVKRTGYEGLRRNIAFVKAWKKRKLKG
jgi:epoxyqueuosine reductase